MIIFRWVIGVIAGLMAFGAVLGFVVFLLFDNDVWLERARVFRRFFIMAALLWFNVEVWGRVVYTLVTW